MNSQVQVDPNLVIQSLTRQIAEQATKIAMLEAYIEKYPAPSEDGETSPSE